MASSFTSIVSGYATFAPNIALSPGDAVCYDASSGTYRRSTASDPIQGHVISSDSQNLVVNLTGNTYMTSSVGYAQPYTIGIDEGVEEPDTVFDFMNMVADILLNTEDPVIHAKVMKHLKENGELVQYFSKPSRAMQFEAVKQNPQNIHLIDEDVLDPGVASLDL